jgi:hypothetical protein
MKQAHREERKKLKNGQEERWLEETKSRSDKLNKGLRGVFDRLTGKAKTTQSLNEQDARHCAIRDQKQRDFMISEQMKERRALQVDIERMRQKHKLDRKILAQSVSQAIRRTQKSLAPKIKRNRNLDLSL